MVDFDPNPRPSLTDKRRAKLADGRRKLLSPRARQWVDGVLKDRCYAEVRDARHWLVHRWLPRNFGLHTKGPNPRLSLTLPTMKVGVRELVEHARDLATRHVSKLLVSLPGLQARHCLSICSRREES